MPLEGYNEVERSLLPNDINSQPSTSDLGIVACAPTKIQPVGCYHTVAQGSHKNDLDLSLAFPQGALKILGCEES